MQYEIRDKDRVAADSIRGYLHQMILTVGEWLSLDSKQVLVCEGNEDIDLIEVDANGRVTSVTEWQHKAEVKAPTGVKALKAVLGFLRAFRSHADAGRACSFVFTTTALLNAKTRKDDDRTVAGAIRSWVVLASVEDADRAEHSSELAEQLARLLVANSTKLGKKGSDEEETSKFAAEIADEIAGLLDYLSEGNRWERFLGAVRWSHGQRGLEDATKAVLSQLAVVKGVVLPPETMLPVLLHSVFSAAVDDDWRGRCLTRDGLAAVFTKNEADLRAFVRDKDIPKLSELISPLVSGAAFFFPVVGGDELFGLMDGLVGREQDLDAMVEFARSEIHDVFVLVGRPGSGKSQLLRALDATVTGSTEGPEVRFVDRHVGALSLTTRVDLPDRALIIHDDAQEGVGLELALACRAHEPANRLVLTTRAERLPLLRERLQRAGVPPTRVREHQLGELSHADARLLARVSLGKPNLSVEESLVVHRDYPYAIVAAGRLIARGEADVGDLQRSDVFREWVVEVLIKRAEAACAAEAAATGLPVRSVLDLLAVVGKLRDPPDEGLAIAAKFLDRNPDEVIRALRSLAAAGVVRRRGRIWSVAPELLADYLVSAACSIPGYGERVFAAFKGESATAVLGRLAEGKCSPCPERSARATTPTPDPEPRRRGARGRIPTSYRRWWGSRAVPGASNSAVAASIRYWRGSMPWISAVSHKL